MRSGNRQIAWKMVAFEDDGSRSLGVATDPAVPIYKIVNDTRLKEMIVSGWAPEREW